MKTKDKSAQMLTRLSQAGVRLTSSRQAVVTVIANSDKPLTPEAVLRHARKLHPSVGLATVYRTLDALQMAQCASRVQLDQQAFFMACFKPQLHVHLICHMCHRLIECDLADVAPRLEQLFAAAGFRPQTNAIEVIGVCGRCRGA